MVVVVVVAVAAVLVVFVIVAVVVRSGQLKCPPFRPQVWWTLP